MVGYLPKLSQRLPLTVTASPWEKGSGKQDRAEGTQPHECPSGKALWDVGLAENKVSFVTCPSSPGVQAMGTSAARMFSTCLTRGRRKGLHAAAQGFLAPETPFTRPHGQDAGEMQPGWSLSCDDRATVLRRQHEGSVGRGSWPLFCKSKVV